MQVENETGLQRWKDAKRALNPLTTMKKHVSPEELFTRLALGRVGAISIDGLVVKRRLFEKIGYFDESLQIFKVLLQDAVRRTRFNWQASTRLSGFQKGVQLFMLPFEFPFVMKESAFWQVFLQLLPPIK